LPPPPEEEDSTPITPPEFADDFEPLDNIQEDLSDLYSYELTGSS